MIRPSPKLSLFLTTFVLALVIDQVTKFWIVERFSYGELHVVIPGFFNLTHVRNPGGAFSFLATMPEGFRQLFFMGTGLLAIVLLLVFFRRLEPTARWSAVAIGGVLGGAIGNLTDRVIYGEVIDFLDFRLIGGYVWPTFNMADCWIVIGVGMLMLEMFLEPEPVEESETDPTSEAAIASQEPGLSADSAGPRSG